jgi:hypothetical protein
MRNGRNAREIKRIRNELLVALRVVYPAGLMADQLLRSLLVLFPFLEFEHVRRDLHYLTEKKYVERIVTDDEGDSAPAWRRRWFRLTAAGLELAERCIRDPALDES